MMEAAGVGASSAGEGRSQGVMRTFVIVPRSSSQGTTAQFSIVWRVGPALASINSKSERIGVVWSSKLGLIEVVLGDR